jgi:ATP adenylyltransferase
MKNIWAPWRIEYILQTKKEDGCIFCNAVKNNDPLILQKGKTCFSIMNKFPYTTGHCMIVPFRHIASIEDLNDNESKEIMTMIKKHLTAIKASLKPQGFNVGSNIGHVAGAGVKEHVHIHIVPRWEGDTNFMPAISEVHMISEHISATKDKIKGRLS